MMIDIATNTRINALHKSLTIAFLAVAIVISGLSADLVRAQSSAPESMLTLTPEEQAWLKNHPEIVLGTTTEYSPMVFKRVDGTHDGMLVDIYEEVSRHLNTRIRLHIEDPWAKVQEKGRNREIDGLAMGGRDPSRDVLYNATDVIVPTYFSVFARSQDEYPLKRFSDLKGMRIGYKRAARPTRTLLEKLPSAILMPYDGHEALTQALLRKEIDVIVAWISYDHWRKEKLQGTIDNILFIEEYPIEMVAHIRKDWPELSSILNKTIAVLQQNDLPRIISKWFGNYPRLSDVTKVSLTPEEQAWLKAHPEIVLGTTTEYSPMVFKRADGTHGGMLVDIYEEVNRRLNTRIRLHVQDPWVKVQVKAQNREIDGLAMGGRSPSRDALYNATDVIVPTYFSVFARTQDEYRLSRFADLKGMRIGYKRAAQPTIALLEKLPSAILMPYDGHEALTQALLRKEIDVIVAWISYDHWRKEKLQGTIDNILLIEEYPIEMVSHIRKDWPELASILNKTIASLQQDELPRIINKWFGRHPRRSTATRVPLTSEERAWLSQNRTVRVRIADWPPYQIAVDDKPLQGIVIEYLKLIKERTGVNFKLEVTEQPFAEFLEGMKRGQGPDMTPIIVPTPEREQYLSFTEPYLFSPYVIFTREEEKPILDISGLVDKTLAVPRGHFVHEKLVGDYPEFDLVLFDSDEKALQAVAIGNADAYIGNLTVASHIIHQRGFYGLQVTSSTPFQEQALAMGIRNDWPELSSILGKALAGITEEEKTGIRNKYLAINFEPGINKTDVLNWLSIVVGLSAFVMLVFVVWNKQLSQKVKERTDELMETESRFRATFEQAAVGVAHVSLKGKFLRINKKFCEIVGYSKDEMLDLTVQDIAHPDDLQADLESARRVLNNEIENYSMDNRYNRKDGSIVWINLTVSLLFDDEDKPNYFVAVAKDISDRKNAEFELEEYQDRLKALATQLTIAEEMERRRIAVELHDNVGQALALVRMQIAAVRKFISDSKQAANLDEVSDCLRQTIRETRDLIFDLSPPQLNEIGLSAAISEWLEEHLEKRYDIRTEFVANGSEIQLDEKLRSILFRNIRELVTNAIKHSQAERVNINMNQTEDHVTISITDDGTGFNAELKAPSLNAEGGFGLFSVRERMADMGGSLEIVSEPGQGTEAILYLPLTMDEVQRRNWS